MPTQAGIIPCAPSSSNALRGFEHSMVMTYFKRYRMEISLRNLVAAEMVLPRGYTYVPWDDSLVDIHADVKYRSFRWEVDASVFPCLGDAEGCLRLMREISQKEGFLASATWLVRHRAEGYSDYCGTIQGIMDTEGRGAIQNVGVTPGHRGHGVGRALIYRALAGFGNMGLAVAHLEVTAQNEAAIKLYRRIGFRQRRTVYKAVDGTYAS